MNVIYLSLGSNQGERFSYLRHALQSIEHRIGTVEKTSSYYETEPWGFNDEVAFINQVIQVKSGLSAMSILKRVLLIEKELGRERQPEIIQRYSGRTIDIDLLFYNNEIIADNKLTIPHKYLHKRRFVLEPMREISPNYIHPIINKSIVQLLSDCNDELAVKKLTIKEIFSTVL